MTPDQEERYRALWLKQLEIDRKVNPLAAGPSPHFKAGLLGGKHGARGGRSAGPVVSEPMTKQVLIVNRLIKRNLALKHIADILGVSAKHISNIKRIYGLPRNEEE